MVFADTPPIVVEDGIRADFGSINARLCTLFDRIVAFDFKESWRVDGASSMVDWLCYLLNLDVATAREYVRMAKALDFLPAIQQNFRDGLLSYDQVRWLTRFVTFDEDVEWSSKALGMRPSEIRTIAVSRERLTRECADARFRRRYLRCRRDRDGGFLTIWARLPDVEGEIVLAAIDRKATVASATIPLDQKRADALVEVCSLALGADADKDRATVVVHTDLDALVSADRNGMLQGGTFIAPETVSRLTCDGRIQMVLHTTDQLVCGKTQRTIPPHLRRALRLRDAHCVFAGCTNEVWLDAHHILHWAKGGLTDLSNLALLCGYHHRLFHEGGWSMYRTDEGDWVFVRPDGRPLFSHATVGAGAKTIALARAP